uniref:Variant surface glycoprotein n=1 Tax=Gongylonema pulchrum TaxID=637853 RepID=A0A183F0T8_9BILA
LGTGNRIATILIYMTEPEIGGGTVFTEVKTAVPCTKMTEPEIGGGTVFTEVKTAVPCTKVSCFFVGTSLLLLFF